MLTWLADLQAGRTDFPEWPIALYVFLSESLERQTERIGDRGSMTIGWNSRLVLSRPFEGWTHRQENVVARNAGLEQCTPPPTKNTAFCSFLLKTFNIFARYSGC